MDTLTMEPERKYRPATGSIGGFIRRSVCQKQSFCELKSCGKLLVHVGPLPKRFCNAKCQKLAWDIKRMARIPVNKKSRPRMTIEQKQAAKEERELARSTAHLGKSRYCKRKWNYCKTGFEPDHPDHQLRLCYFMGLCSAILLIDETHRENGRWRLEVVEEKLRDKRGRLIGFTQHHTGKVLPDLKSEELAKYAHKLGDRFKHDYDEEQALLARQRKAVKRLGRST